jgi:hypothetical protein
VCSPTRTLSIASFGFNDLWQPEKNAVNRQAEGKVTDPTVPSFSLEKGILAAVEKNARGGVGTPANRVKDCVSSSPLPILAWHEIERTAWFGPWVKRLLTIIPQRRYAFNGFCLLTTSTNCSI